MKTIASVLLRICCTIILVMPGTLSAQMKTLTQLRDELVSSWLVTVEGEDRTRTLKIAGAALKSDDTLLLDAVYGWSDGNQTPTSASLVQSGQETRLLFTTQPGSKIATIQTGNGTFEGTFTLTNGTAKPVRIQKVTEDELQAKIAAAKEARAALIVKPGHGERPTFSVGDKWQYEFANKRYAKPGCRYTT